MPTNVTRSDAAQSSPSFAEQMVAKLQGEVFAGSGGVRSTTVDGVSVETNRSEMLRELRYWQKVVAREKNTQPLSLNVDLSDGP